MKRRGRPRRPEGDNVVSIQFWIETDIKDKLKEMANQEGLSMTEIIVKYWNEWAKIGKIPEGIKR